ncbi:MAG TPA: DNA-processing protein DprA [Candidatus Nitrosocosmicus sp.]|nr:DNA-processing protein DprA [Candidatus Nitrosocosmicus sp.]
MTKIAIVGSRDYPHPHKIQRAIEFFSQYECEIVSGGARGVDSQAEQIARNLGLPVTIFHANWNMYGNRAGAMRNKQIVDYADVIVAFWDGKSKGTQITVGMAKRAGKKVLVIQ